MSALMINDLTGAGVLAYNSFNFNAVRCFNIFSGYGYYKTRYLILLVVG
jgi:hypothetical protein